MVKRAAFCKSPNDSDTKKLSLSLHEDVGVTETLYLYTLLLLVDEKHVQASAFYRQLKKQKLAQTGL